MRIQHNIMAMNAYRNYTNNVSAMKKNLEKLSSGYKINRAGDDAAGLAISEKMRAQITGLETAQKNAKDGISLVQTAEGALTEVHDMLNRMVELATQSANGTYDNTTDRYQMQKEVDQLLSEIDRIRDSSNFNGIKLLNGTLGLNTDAFSFSSVAAVEANDGSLNLSDLLAQTADGDPKIHFEGAGASAATPAATIDLGDLNFEAAANTDTVNLKIEVAGTTYSIDFTGKTTYTTGDIVDSLKTAMGTHSAADGAVGNAKDAVKIGNGLFKLTTAGSKLNLVYAGRFSAGGTIDKAETTFAGTSTDAENLNKALGFDVTVKSKGDKGTWSGNVIHKATNVEQAVAKVDAGLAGIDIKLNENLIVEGGTLEIDGKIFTFKTDANSTLAGAGVIDVSKAKNTAERIHMAADKLSKEAEFTGKESRKWKIGVNSDGTTIHIDQTSKTTDATKLLKDYDAIAALIKAKGTATSAANAGTKITITDANVKEGNVLTIGEGDNAKKYEFTDDKDKLAKGTNDDGSITYVKIDGGAAQNLANAISGSKYDAADNSVTVYAAKAGDKAPMVLGKGLTLQIGDTSDAFNQLNVAVQDMNAESLGIGGLKIDTEEQAQDAINKIKNAINTVSDVRGTLGATQNRLDHTINNLSVMTENIQDAESTIRDTDVAEEMMAYTKNNILIQSAQAMLAQANQVPQGVLQLLQ